jgi:protein-L-isoaspartate O-methyltransferase
MTWRRRRLIAGLAKLIRRPQLIFCLFRRYVLLGSVRKDPELMHMVVARSSGSLRRLTVNDLFPGIDSCDTVTIRKPEARTIGASVDLPELIHLIAAAKYISAKRILEIGTFDGFTALNIAANLKDQGEVCTLDLPEEDQNLHSTILNATKPNLVGVQFLGEAEANKIKQFRADSGSMDWNSFGAPFDMILIDGCHTYPYVMSDSTNALRHLRPDGILFWHDYGFIDVSRGGDELAREYPIFAITGTRLACFRNPLPERRLTTSDPA